LDRYGIQVVVLKSDSKSNLKAKLEQTDGWRLAKHDHVATVFLREATNASTQTREFP
jgi:hypothetical protein